MADPSVDDNQPRGKEEPDEDRGCDGHHEAGDERGPLATTVMSVATVVKNTNEWSMTMSNRRAASSNKPSRLPIVLVSR